MYILGDLYSSLTTITYVHRLNSSECPSELPERWNLAYLKFYLVELLTDFSTPLVENAYASLGETVTHKTMKTK